MLFSSMFQICFKNDAYVAWKFVMWYSPLKSIQNNEVINLWNSETNKPCNEEVVLLSHYLSLMNYIYFSEMKKSWHATYSNSIDIIHIGSPTHIIEKRGIQIFWYVLERRRVSIMFRKKKVLGYKGDARSLIREGGSWRLLA